VIQRSNNLITTNRTAIATLKNELRKERQRHGIKAARTARKYFGRRTVVDKKPINGVQYLKETKNLSITQIYKITRRAISTIYKVLK
jgi:DNA invertase Pin-like site-specific DNA recombinase